MVPISSWIRTCFGRRMLIGWERLLRTGGRLNDLVEFDDVDIGDIEELDEDDDVVVVVRLGPGPVPGYDCDCDWG